MPRIEGENTPSSLIPIEGEEQLSQQWYGMAERVIQGIALDYRKKYRLPPINQGGLQLANRIVGKAFLGEMTGLGNIPEDEASIKKMTEQAIERRNTRLQILSAKVDDLNTDNKGYDHGLDRTALRNAKSKMRDMYALEDLTEVEPLVEEVEARGTLIPRISAEIVVRETGIAEGEDYDRNMKAINSLSVKAAVIRGEMVSGMIAMVDGERSDPLFISEEDIDRLIDISASEENLDEIIQQLAKRFSMREDLSEDEQGVAERMMADYARQAIDAVNHWSKTKEYQTGIKHKSSYWKKKQDILASLPIVPLITGRQLVVELDGLEQAVMEGTPHLWEEGVEFEDEGVIVPSPPRLRDYRRLLERNVGTKGQRPPEVRSISSALESWSRFRYENRTIDQRLQTVSNRADRLEDEAGEVIDDREKFLLMYETRELREEARIGKKRLGQYEAADSEVRENRRFLKKLAAEDEEEVLRNPALTAIVLRDQSETRKNSSERKFLKKSRMLRRIGWKELLVKGYPEDYDDERIGWEREVVQSAIDSLSIEGGSQLPEQFKDTERVQQFLERWRITLQATRNSKQSLRKRRIKGETETMIELAQSLYKRGGLDYGVIKDWIREDLERQLKDLNSAYEAYYEREFAKYEYEQIQQSLDQDNYESNSMQDRSARIPTRDLRIALRQLKMRTVPEELEDSVDDDQIEEANNLVSINRGDPFTFKIPRWEDVPQALEEQKKRKAVRGSEKREKLLESLQRNLDNPVLPWENSEGSNLSPFMKATELRATYLEAQRKAFLLRVEVEQIERKMQENKDRVSRSDSAKELQKARGQLKNYEKQRSAARKDFLDEIRRLGLLAPAEIFDK